MFDVLNEEFVLFFVFCFHLPYRGGEISLIFGESESSSVKILY